MKSGSVNLPTLFFFIKIVLAIMGPLNFHVNFKISLSVSAKKISVESVDHLGEYCDLKNIKCYNP